MLIILIFYTGLVLVGDVLAQDQEVVQVAATAHHENVAQTSIAPPGQNESGHGQNKFTDVRSGSIRIDDLQNLETIAIGASGSSNGGRGRGRGRGRERGRGKSIGRR